MKCIILIGLPGSGKSTWAQDYVRNNNKNITILSSDAYRKEMFGDESIQRDPKKVFTKLANDAKKLLSEGKSIIIDATNVTPKSRKTFIDIAKQFQCFVIAQVFLTTPELCKQRNGLRNRKVPEEVIDNMSKKFTLPRYEEGFDIINYEV